MTIATAPVRTDILRIFNPFVGCPRGAGVLRLSRPVVFVGCPDSGRARRKQDVTKMI
jgi:hypothetical protein